MIFTSSQIKAIETSNENILVSAGAGSGKTGVLKERVIHKLKQGIHIDELIILTFTKQAAAEMKTRIIKAINQNPELMKELSKIDNAIISTFDSFCLKLVKEYHYLLDLPSNITIGDKIQFMTMEKMILEETIKDYYLRDDHDFNNLVVSLFQKGDQIIYDAVSNLASKLQKEPNYNQVIRNFETKYFESKKLARSFEVFENILYQKLDKAKQIFKTLHNKIHGYSEKSDEYLSNLSNYFDHVINSDFNTFMQNILSLPLTRKLSIKNDDNLKAVITEYHDQFKNLINEVKRIINDLHIQSKEEAISRVTQTKKSVLKLVEIAEEYLRRLDQQKHELGLYSFQDVMDLATSLLENNKDIAKLYQTSINEIMIDEYQDTNDLQEYFVSLISNNNLFMVGDIKQSIYGFRDANPKNFLKKYLDYSAGMGGLAIDLRENFRSRKNILADINSTFETVMDSELGGIDYQNKQSLIYGLNKYDNEINTQKYGIDVIKYDSDILLESEDYQDKVDIEARLLAIDIRNKILNKYQIYDINQDEFRDIVYSDIAILVDRKGNFNRLSKVLSKYNIPVNLYSDEPFIDSEEMLFLTSYIKLIYCFTNELYLKNNFQKMFFSVARSFVFKIEDQDIINFLVNDKIESLKNIYKLKNYEVFNNLYSITKIISENIYKLPIYDILIMIYQELDIYKMISYLENPRKKEEKLDYFAATIKGFERFSFTDLIDYLDSLEKNDNWDIEYSKTNPDKEAIKLMTMHKAKGLQFPVVYCPLLYKGFNFSENKDFFIYDKEYGLVANAFDNGFNHTYLRYLSLYKTKKEYISERIRLLYVAFTRTMENLVLFLDQSDILEGYDCLEGKYIDNDIRLKYSKYTHLISSTKIKDYDYLNKPLDDILPETKELKIESNFMLENKNFNFKKELVLETSYSKQTQNIMNDSVKKAIEYGKDVHKLLEDVDFNDLEASLSILPIKIRQSLKKLLDSKLFDFDKNPFIYQEYEFYDTIDNNTVHGVIDLLIVYDDVIYILDYKLKNIDDLAYAKQMNGYKKYIGTKTKKPMQLYLYSVLDEILTEV